MALRSLMMMGLLFGVGSRAQAADPAWWSGTIRSGDSHAISDNYAPANLGQLKSFADQARAHLDIQLAGVGGSGYEIESMVAGWTGPVADNYQPLNLGQLKAVVDKFYARLDTVGFDYKSQLLANGYPAGRWTTNPDGKPRPWNESAPPDANYAPANLGQIKILFNFDISGFTSPLPSGGDYDHDGITNGQEAAAGSDPYDYFSQGGAHITPRIFVYSGAGAWVPSGQYSVDPIVYKVVNAATGAPLVNAPVSVSLDGPGWLASSSGGAPQTTPLPLLSDAQGLVKVFFVAP